MKTGWLKSDEKEICSTHNYYNLLQSNVDIKTSPKIECLELLQLAVDWSKETTYEITRNTCESAISPLH